MPHDPLELCDFSVAQEVGSACRVMNRGRISLSVSHIVTGFKGLFFYEILFWENRRNKSGDFSPWLCQARVLMISVAAAVRRSSLK